MKQPTKEQVLEAGRVGGPCVKAALTKLYPKAFERPIQAGEIYKWGTDNDGGSCAVIDMLDTFCLVNLHSGFCYSTGLPKSTTKEGLVKLFNVLPHRILHDCYSGSLKGPLHLTSWVTK